jgi:peptidyl-prolyl cis-trans isomerase SurA
MRWRNRLASGVLGFSLAAVGCVGSDSWRDSLKTDPDRALLNTPPDPSANSDLLRTIEAMGRGDENVTRAQAPDTDQPIVVARAQAPATSPPVQPVAYSVAAQVTAVVNDEAILFEELQAVARDPIRYCESLPEPDRSKRRKEVLDQALNSLIDREVVMQDALARFKNVPGGEKNYEKIKEVAEHEFDKNYVQPIKKQFHIKSDEDFKAFLKEQGMSFDMQKRLVERSFIAQEYLKNLVWGPVDKGTGHVQIVEYYDAHPEMFKMDDEVEWQDLFIAAGRHATREAAQRFAEVQAQRVRQGEDFVQLADQCDDGDSKLRKSQGQGRKHGEIKPAELEATLFALKEGDVAVVEQPGGFHVVRVVKRQFAGLAPFDEKTQKFIRDKLRMEIMQRETKRIVLELRHKAVIEVYK